MSHNLFSTTLFSTRSSTPGSQRRKTTAGGMLLALIMLSMTACAREDAAAAAPESATAVTTTASAADTQQQPDATADSSSADTPAQSAPEAQAQTDSDSDSSKAAETTGAASAPSATTPVATAAAPATGAPAAEGKEYYVLKKPLTTSAPAGKVEVLEFFWYRCPHCHEFEPQLNKWAQQMGDSIVFKRVPVFFGRPGMEEEQRLYYTLETMGLTDSLHQKLFNAVHNSRIDLTSQKKMADWLEKQGVDRAAFNKAFKSFGVNTRTKQAQKIQDQYMVDGVPAVAINGTYYTSPSIAGSIARSLEVSTQLVQKSQQQK